MEGMKVRVNFSGEEEEDKLFEGVTSLGVSASADGVGIHFADDGSVEANVAKETSVFKRYNGKEIAFYEPSSIPAEFTEVEVA